MQRAAYASKTFSVGIATRVPQMMWTELTKAVFRLWCCISWIWHGRTRQYIFFLPHLLPCSSLSPHLLSFPIDFFSEEEKQHKNPTQTLPSATTPAVLTADPEFQLWIKSTNLLSFYAACLAHVAFAYDPDFNSGDLCFRNRKERNTSPKESKSCPLTFSAFGFSVHLTWPDRSGEEKH